MNKIDLIPPPDMAWMWHCHRLAPYRYAEHATTLVPSSQESVGLLDPSHPFVFQLEGDDDDDDDDDDSNSENDTWLSSDNNEHYAEIAKRTRDLFAEMYPGENFFSRGGGSGNHNPDEELRCFRLSGYDLLAACQRQSTFLWQVSGPEFLTQRFANEGIANYIRFAKLVQHPSRNNHKSVWLVPTYQIDWLWHTHILTNTAGYHQDIARMTSGAVLDHDDSINDRTEGGVLDTSFRDTSILWKEVYGKDYFVVGGMYRGEPPFEYYRRDYFQPPPPEPEPPKPPWNDLATAAVVAEATRNGQADIIHAYQWMPPGHVLAFFPYNKCRRGWLALRANPKKKDYVFGRGNQGVGYYHMHTHEGIRVLRDRCDRKSRHSCSIALVATIVFVGPLLCFRVEEYMDMDLDLVFFLALCTMAYLGFMIRKCSEMVLMKETRYDAYRRLFAEGPAGTNGGPDAIERGAYHLYNEDRSTSHLPRADPLVEAAGCGMCKQLYDLKRYGRFGQVHVGIDGDGGGGCGGGGCGGGGCGGG